MGGLSFLSPLYLLGALAVVVPILLHLFRRRTDTVIDFPAVRLLPGSPVEQQRRRRLREIILLILRVTALVLLAGAFARPYLVDGAAAADAPVTIVAVDTSFSVSAPAVFERVRRAAATAVAEAPSGHAVALVSFGDSASTVVAPTTDRGAVVAAVATLAPGPSSTRYGAALARAAELIGWRPGRVVVVTDLQQAGWQGAAHVGIPDDVPVSVMAVEAPTANVAVMAANLRGNRLEATVHNFGFEPRTVPASLGVDGRQMATTRVTVPARAATAVTFDAELPVSGAATITIEDPGGFVADDTRYLVLDREAASRVTVVVADPTSLRGGLYVERALQVADEGRAFAVTVADGRALSAWTPEQLAREHALVVLGTRTLERRGRDLVAAYLAQGGSMLLALGPDVDPATLGDVMGGRPGVSPDAAALTGGSATLVLSDPRHPVFRSFAEPAASLADVLFQRHRPIEERGRSVLARYSGGAAAIVEEPRERGRVLIVTSDLDNQWNRFPISPAFVPFVIEAARYLTEGRRQTRAYVLPSAPLGLAPSPGVVTVPAGDGDSADNQAAGRRVAINVDTRESNPAAMTPDEFVAAVPRAARGDRPDPVADARKAEDQQRLWQMGLLAMFLALAAEGLIGRRANG